MEKFLTGKWREKTSGPANNEKGFSLIELAIAMVIISFFLGVIYVASKPYMARAAYQSTSAQLSQILVATTSYFGDTGGYPQCFLDLDGNNGINPNQRYLTVAPPQPTWSVTCGGGVPGVVGGVAKITVKTPFDPDQKVLHEFQRQCGIDAVSVPDPDYADLVDVTCFVDQYASCVSVSAACAIAP